MKLLKVYVYPEANKEFPTILGTGTLEACQREIDLLTEQHEREKTWMIEEIEEPNKLTRKFATEKHGLVFKLVICEEMQVPSHYVEY